MSFLFKILFEARIFYFDEQNLVNRYILDKSLSRGEIFLHDNLHFLILNKKRVYKNQWCLIDFRKLFHPYSLNY